MTGLADVTIDLTMPKANGVMLAGTVGGIKRLAQECRPST